MDLVYLFSSFAIGWSFSYLLLFFKRITEVAT